MDQHMYGGSSGMCPGKYMRESWREESERLALQKEGENVPQKEWTEQELIEWKIERPTIAPEKMTPVALAMQKALAEKKEKENATPS